MSTIDKVVWNRWLPYRNLALVSTSVKMACVCNQRNGYYYSGIHTSETCLYHRNGYHLSLLA